MKKTFCIAIDGPSSSGKSSVAKEVARRLGYHHIDSGAIYRSLAWWREKHKGPFVYRVEGEGRHFVGDHEVTREIRTPHISRRASEMATDPEVRAQVNEIQRAIAKNRSVVIEGRDIGSVVFPKAELKIFLVASLEERARRRFAELCERGIETTLEEVEEDLIKRDERDQARKDAPLIKARDAHTIDTTNFSLEEVVTMIVALVESYDRKPALGYRLLRGMAWMILRGLYGLEVRGLEHYPRGAAIIAPNHASFLDPPSIGVACPEEVYFVAHVYLFKSRILKWLAPYGNTHPIASDKGDLQTLKIVTTLLMQGKKVVLFPEGSRSFDNQLQPLKRGIAMLASVARTKVIPVQITGAYEIWPRKQRWPKWRGKIVVTFCPPLDWNDYADSNLPKKEVQAQFIQDLEERLKGENHDSTRTYHKQTTGGH